MMTHHSLALLNCPDSVSFAKDIRPMFTDDDVSHMKMAKNIDLSDYQTVKVWASKIFSDVSSGRMPPPDFTEARWTPDMVMKFGCWMKLGYHP